MSKVQEMTKNDNPKDKDVEVFDVYKEPDRLGTWLAVFMSRSFARQQPDLAVYARVIARLSIRATPLVPYMGVTHENNKYLLLYNAEWVNNTTFGEFVTTLAHEALHILCGDIPRFLNVMAGVPHEDAPVYHHMLNISMDAANNSLLQKRHRDMLYGATGYWVLPKTLGLPADLTTELYLEGLLNYADEIKEMIKEEMEKEKDKGDEECEDEEGDEEGGEDEGDEDGGDEDGDDGEGDEDGDEDGDGKSPGLGDGEGDSDGDDGKPCEPDDSAKEGDLEDGNDKQKPSDKDTDKEGSGTGAPGGKQLPKKNPTAADYAKNAAMSSLFKDQLKNAVQQAMAANSHDWMPKHGDGSADAAGAKLADSAGDVGYEPYELGILAEALQSQGEAILKQALQEQQGIGSLPSHLQHMLDELLKEAQIPWAKMMARMITPRILARRKATMKRPSKRRFTLFQQDEDGELIPLPSPIPQYPGGKRDRTYHIMFALDVSGSMSNVDIIEGLSEMKGITRAFPDTKIITVQVDTHIAHVTTIGPDFDVEEYVETIGRRAHGGTAFDQPFVLCQYMAQKIGWPTTINAALRDEVPQIPVDMVVYLTDTFAYNWPSKKLDPGVPVLWLVPSAYESGHNSQPIFGSVLVRS